MPDVRDRQQGIPTGRVGKMFNVCVGVVKVWAYQMDRFCMPICYVYENTDSTSFWMGIEMWNTRPNHAQYLCTALLKV